MRVLLVDDEALIRMDVKEALETYGAQVVGEGKNGIEAIELAKTVDADVLVMDIKMPLLDGIEAARQIQYHKSLPILFLTAYNQVELVEKAMDSGAYGYLVKPFRESDLWPTIRMAVSRFHEKAELQRSNEKLKHQIEERKILEKAKGILMELYDFTEEQAYSRMRTYSMNKGLSMIQVAQAVLRSEKGKKSKK